MKIAFFTDTYYPELNGVAVSVDNFAKELRKQGHTVYIFAPRYRKQQSTDSDLTNLPSIKVFSAESAIYFPMPTSYSDYAKIFRLELDIVHAHGNGAFSILGYQVARMKRIPYLLTFHTQFTKYTHYIFNGKLITQRMVQTGIRLSANICDTIIAPSEKMKKELLAYGVKKPVKVIPNFVNTNQFKTIKKHYLHEKFSIPKKNPILLSVGRLGKEKNFAFVIDAFIELAQKEAASHLVIVGGGKEKKTLIDQAARSGIKDRIHFTGKITNSHMPSVYADADIFVFASTSEVHPLVILEASTVGLPIVVANDPAFSGLVINNKNGFVVSLKKEAFANKLHQLLTDTELRIKFGKYSKSLVEGQFNPEKLGHKLIKVYEETIKETKASPNAFQAVNNRAILRLKKTTKIFERVFRNA